MFRPILSVFKNTLIEWKQWFEMHIKTPSKDFNLILKRPPLNVTLYLR